MVFDCYLLCDRQRLRIVFERRRQVGSGHEPG